MKVWCANYISKAGASWGIIDISEWNGVDVDPKYLET